MASSGLGKVYANGETIVRQGDEGSCMYVIQQGKVEIVKKDSGRELRIAVLEAGDFFGEMAIFEHETRSATVKALGEASILTVDRKTLMRRIQEDPTLAFNLLETMSGRIRRLDRELVKAKGSSGEMTQT